MLLKILGPVPARPISANPGLQFCFPFCIYPPVHFLEEHFVLSFLFFKVKAQQYFVRSSYTFLYKKTLLKIWLNPGLNLTIFRGTRPSSENGWKRARIWRTERHTPPLPRIPRNTPSGEFNISIFYRNSSHWEPDVAVRSVKKSA